MHALAQAVGAVALLRDRPLDVRCGHLRSPGFARPMIGFAQQVGYRFDIGGKLARVPGKARSMLNHARDRGALKGGQPLLACDGGDELSEEPVVFGCALETLFEIGGDLEQLPEVGVVRLQKVIDKAVAEENDLDVEGNRFGRQRQSADEAVHLGQRFDANLAVGERALQPLPGEGLHQQLARIEQEVASVGTMQRPRPDQREIGDQRPELRDMIDATDEVLVSGMILLHDQRTLAVAVVDDEVDLVAAERRRLRRSAHDARLRLARLDEILGIFDHILLNRLHVLQHPRQIAVFLLQLRHVLPDRKQGHLAVELLQALALLAAPAHDISKNALELALQLADATLDARTLLVLQRREILRRDHLPVLERRESKARGRAQQPDVVLGGLAAQLSEGFLVTLREFGLDLPGARAVLVAFEDGRNGRTELVHECAHVVAQGRAAPGRELEDHRLRRFLKVIDIGPVARLHLSRHLARKLLLHERALADSGRTHHEQVVAFPRDADAEAHGIDRARLPKERWQRFQIGTGLKLELRRIAAAIECFRRKTVDAHISPACMPDFASDKRG